MLPPEPWLALLGEDPRPWILESPEPAARWVALTELLDRREDDPEAIAARRDVLADDGTRRILGLLPDWEVDQRLSGHDSPGFAPNLLLLLADMGVRPGDDARVERLLDLMLQHQEPDGRFASFGSHRLSPEPIWGSLLCDNHAVVEVLVRLGRGDDDRVVAATRRMAADIAGTPQGRGWPCLPHSVSGLRGPGRRGDLCPQVTLEALRAFARLPVDRRPPGLLEIARTSLRAWRMRGEEKPYLFGHGVQFKTVKWPPFWYGIYQVLDTIGRYPELWRDRAADASDRQAIAELAACLVAYNFEGDGRVTPRSCYRGFAEYSFGQKKQPSPFATARLCAILRRFSDLTPEIASVDVLSLASSKGGSGTAMPPRQ